MQPTYFGHPKGLFYLAFTEAWERFSYYGMTALVVLYMVNHLFLPGQVENIAGFAQMRHAIETVTGPLSVQALASQVFGIYAGLVYLTPVLGGIIADRWIGQRTAVAIGAISMSAGHVAMAADRTFLLALLLLVIGSGFLKGNITSQVGALYPSFDESKRTRGFIIFNTGINIGAVGGPLLCGLLAQLYGWHYGFGIAAIFMLLGLATYLYGYRYLPTRVARADNGTGRLTNADLRIVGALSTLIALSILPSIAQFQLYNVGAVWIQQHVAAKLGSFEIPVPWYQALYSLSSVLCVPVILAIWRKQASLRCEPRDLAKIAIGSGLTAASNLVLAVASYWSDGAVIDPVWPILYCTGLGIGFMYYWPTLLALVSRVSPRGINATMMGVTFISMASANSLIGWIGGFYERLSSEEFWALHVAIAAAGSVMLMLLGRRMAVLDERGKA